MSVKIVWPEQRDVPETLIVGWYLDAVSNKELMPTARTTKEMALALHDFGHITLSRDNEWRDENEAH